MNYERIIQWVSGPFAVAVGGVATKLIAAHGALLSSVGLSVRGTSQAIVSAVVFLVSAGVTYAGHHKWLTNAAKWWTTSGLTLPAGLAGDTPPDTTVTTGGGNRGGNPSMLTVPTSHAVAALTAESNADKLRQQLRDAGINPEV